MTDHDLLIALNMLRTIILIASLIGALTYQHIDRRIVLVVASILLFLNLCGLVIATLLVNHVH